MTQHTPGPWVAVARTNAYIEIEAPNQPGYSDKKVATASLTNHEANARLIAAAPDLLKALKECRNAIQGGQEVAPYDSRGAGYEQTFGLAFLEYLNAAIAKAESK